MHGDYVNGAANGDLLAYCLLKRQEIEHVRGFKRMDWSDS